ncbi:hypothetical protein CUN85_11260 [Methanolobus halotolerans]|uniref:LSM domain-containing protein n=1 Tax=Methanolobus halotolerans TaxID=2052935 RepID=A0A4E0Q333_9EURY|nr:hypothetical protein CUN85_11260 [Methanolobus halotolerans]
MPGIRKDPNDDHLLDFTGVHVRVITRTSHYRGICVRIDHDSDNVLLNTVLQKTDAGWVDISDRMLVMGSAIESIYIEKSFPFDSNESLILAIDKGDMVEFDAEATDLEGLE